MSRSDPEAVELNPISYDFHDDPYPIYRRLRDEAPVYWNEEHQFFALSRFADVHGAFRDWETFSNSRGIALETMPMGGSETGMMLEMDPPDHTRLRKLVSKVFTPRRINELETRIREIVRHYVEPFRRAGGGDLIGEVCGPFPMDVISVMLGVESAADRAHLRHLADDLVAREDGRIEIPPKAVTAWMDIQEYFRADVARRRSDPDDGLIGALIETDVDGERLTDREVIGFAFLFVVAGHETTTKLLGNLALELWRHPDQRRELGDDPSLIPNALEEILRYNTSSQYMARYTRRRSEYHGVAIPPDSVVLLLIGAAQRDDREFEDPDRFDIHRDIRRSLAFGSGPHFCLGASLARLEGRVAVEELLPALGDYDIDLDGCERIHAGNVMGYHRIPVST
ncbi:MAG TPA: cytochrome P450 [Acidimicrobiales bacterium]